MKNKILILDEEVTVTSQLKVELEKHGHDVQLVNTLEKAQTFLKQLELFCILVVEPQLLGKDGFALLGIIKENHPDLKIILTPKEQEKDGALRGFRLGASDYFEKPINVELVSQSVERCLREYRAGLQRKLRIVNLETRVQRVEGPIEDRTWFVSKTRAMALVNERLTNLRRDTMRGNTEEPTVFITGEKGTGKEAAARIIHSGSRNGRGPWVVVNCASPREKTLDAEIFGPQGSWVTAQGGTLLLNQVEFMDSALQAKLVSFLEAKKMRKTEYHDLSLDVRVLATSVANIRERIKDGKFRGDLHALLSQVTLELPPLRERQEDIIPLASVFAERSFHSHGKNFEGFSANAQTSMKQHGWLGNVLELFNVLERVALLKKGNGPVSQEELFSSPGNNARSEPRLTSHSNGNPVDHSATSISSHPAGETDHSLSYTEMKKKWCDSFEKDFLMTTLDRNKGNVSAAAREAKLDRSNFLRLLRRHGLKAQEYRKQELPNQDVPKAA